MPGAHDQNMKRISVNGKDRSDRAENCPERFDLDFLKYILNFRRKFRSRTMKLLSDHHHIEVYHFKHPRELDLYLKTTSIGPSAWITGHR